MLTFKTIDVNHYAVLLDGRKIGSAKKDEMWTVRGTRVVWDAMRRGRVVGTYYTRKEAGELLAAMDRV